MIRRLKLWATCADCHVNGWMLKFLFAGAFTLLGYATEQATGLEVGQPAAYMFCGAYLFDTPHDLIFTPGDPWYDHVMDVVVPCGTSLGLMAAIEGSKGQWENSSDSLQQWSPVLFFHASAGDTSIGADTLTVSLAGSGSTAIFPVDREPGN